MPRQILISGSLDATEDTVSATKSNAQLNNVAGILAQVRDYVLRDNVGKYSPFTNRGFFARNQWRNQDITDTNEAGFKIFNGAINSLASVRNDFGFTTIVKSREAMGIILEFKVEENDIFAQDALTGLSEFRINNGAGYPAGHTGPITIDAQGATPVADIPAPSLVAFTDSLIPRYQILSLDATSITLDRALESILVDDQQLRVHTAVERTGAATMRRSLISAGLANRLGSSFIEIDAVDSAAGRKLRLFILSTDNITLKSHLALVLELCDLYLTFNPQTGIIDIVRGLDFDGLAITDRVSDDELIGPIETTYDFSKLVFGYDLFFSNGSEIGQAQGQVDESVIDDWANEKVWSPLKPGGSAVMGEKYLYNSGPTADFFGERRLAFYGQPRIIVTSPVKQAFSGNPLDFLNIQLVKAFSVSMKTSRNEFFAEEPARVVGFVYDENNFVYSKVSFMLTNIPTPNIPRIVDYPATPE